MTPEQRLDRLERIAELMARPDPRARRQRLEQSEKIKIIIAAQKENEERMVSQRMERDQTIAFLAASETQRERSHRMPTILRIGPYRFFFYAGDGGEPAHVHVVRDECIAKVWLDPVILERRGAFHGTELR